MRYYFDSDDDRRATHDEDGQECGDLKTVREAAFGALPDLVQDGLPDGDRRAFTVKVRDESGRYVFQATQSLVATWLT